MKEDKVLQFAITPHFKLSIDKEDGSEPETWRLCLDYRALARIEDATGLDLKKFEAWKEISSKHFPKIVWGALQRFNPDVEVDHVIDILNPEAQRILSDKLFELCFPGVREAWEKSLKETGEPNSPNAQEAGTTNT